MEENNKIIAEFMELEVITEQDFLNYTAGTMTNKTVIDVSLKYHNDWNWLMEVVEKIENTKIKDYSVSTNITNDKTYISVWHYNDGGKWSILISNLNEKYKNFNKIERTYKAVIEFINFYNKQKEE